MPSIIFTIFNELFFGTLQNSLLLLLLDVLIAEHNNKILSNIQNPFDPDDYISLFVNILLINVFYLGDSFLAEHKQAGLSWATLDIHFWIFL